MQTRSTKHPHLHTTFDPDTVLVALQRCWSIHTSSRWTEMTPATGQCAVTALVVHHYFGAEIVKTKIRNEWHFYNRIGDEFFDLTAEQFHGTVEYQHIPSTPAEAMRETTQKQYKSLKAAFENTLLNSSK